MFTDLRHAVRLLAKSPGFTIDRRAGARRSASAPTPPSSASSTACCSSRCRSPMRSGSSPSTRRCATSPTTRRILDFLDWRAQATTLRPHGGVRDGGGDADRPRRRRSRCRSRSSRPICFSLLGVAPLQGRVFTADDDEPRRAADGGDLRSRCGTRRFSRDPSIVGRADHARRRSGHRHRRDAGQLRVPVRRRGPDRRLDADHGVALRGAVGRPARRVVPDTARPAAARRRRRRRRRQSSRRSPARHRGSEPAQRHARRARASVPGRARRRLPPRARRAALGGRGGAADRVRERRQPAARARHGAAARNRRAHRARREPRAASCGSSCARASCSPRSAALGGTVRRAVGRRRARARSARCRSRGCTRVQIDRVVLGFTMLASMLTGILCGLVPAFQLSRADPGDALKDGDRGGSGAHGARTRQVAGRRRSRAVAGAARGGRPAGTQPDRRCSA